MMVVKNRILSAIRGAFVADAAGMGTHWIYDPTEMAKEVPSVEAPEFKTPPTPRYYSSEEFPGHYGPGMLSPYGEQLLFVTQYVASEGKVDGETMSKAMLEWAETFGGRPDSALKDFIENMKKDDGKWPNCGADDFQAHCYMKLIPVTCLYAGKPELKDKVKEAIKVHQNNEMAIAFGLAASTILEAVLLGSSLQEALDAYEKETKAEDDEQKQDSVVMEAFNKGKKAYEDGQTMDDFLKVLSNELMKDSPDSPFYNLYGRSCALPGSFAGPIQQLYVAASSGDDGIYAKVLRTNILASGDTVSRAQIIGAIVGAASGGPPQDWIDRMDKDVYEKVDAAANAIAELSTASS